QRVADESRLTIRNGRVTRLGGLSAGNISSNREAVITEISLGDRTNTLHATRTALVVASLPNGVAGILDPTDIYSPFGYSIDIPNGRIESSDANSNIGPLT